MERETAEQGIELQVLSHPECDVDVIAESDIVGSSEVLREEALRLVQKENRYYANYRMWYCR